MVIAVLRGWRHPTPNFWRISGSDDDREKKVEAMSHGRRNFAAARRAALAFAWNRPSLNSLTRRERPRAK
ncbi:MAG: hypothetical protein WBP94_07880, partial [Rhodomicrobiaceae bacterium]